ncbi:MAG: hypothetical protein HVN35_07300 [Methanobacteriaceae archaeon]|nr:hypothetical protein [Methanobacteriaceae archaeon]
MPRITRYRGYKEPYNSNANCNAPSYSGYCMQEKEEILNELSFNMMEKMYQREVYSIRRNRMSWQMSK